MKWSTFLAGSIIGATAASVLAKKKPEMFATATQAVQQMCSGVKNNLLGKMLSGSMAGVKEMKSPKQEGVSAEQSKKDWEQIEWLAENDPAAKREIENIMSSQKETRAH
ncbi:hypothetical protein EBB07_31815 [Paenibacillaceae bacterium]|nr:hypothetical protein EBB07_31815 [Paenibacillaceae bacterium]